jgi:hypothetical protein
MATHPLKIFDVYDMQFPPVSFDRKIQETIDYCECRFRSILVAFRRASEGRQRVVQRRLHSELVFLYVFGKFLLLIS